MATKAGMDTSVLKSSAECSGVAKTPSNAQTAKPVEHKSTLSSPSTTIDSAIDLPSPITSNERGFSPDEQVGKKKIRPLSIQEPPARLIPEISKQPLMAFEIQPPKSQGSFKKSRPLVTRHQAPDVYPFEEEEEQRWERKGVKGRSREGKWSQNQGTNAVFHGKNWQERGFHGGHFGQNWSPPPRKAANRGKAHYPQARAEGAYPTQKWPVSSCASRNYAQKSMVPKIVSKVGNNYPLVYVDPNGSISVLLSHDMVVELTMDRTIRVLHLDDFSAAVDSGATTACMMHPSGRIHQRNTNVYAHFGEEKLAMIGSNGIIFTMKGLNVSYLLTSVLEPKGTQALHVPESQLFPPMSFDFTLDLFQRHSPAMESANIRAATDLVRGAKHTVTQEGVQVELHGMTIRQNLHGEVEVEAPPRFLFASPKDGTLSIRTHYVDMGVTDENFGYVKRGVKRVHVSPSGIVASDGQLTSSMDFSGALVSTA